MFIATYFMVHQCYSVCTNSALGSFEQPSGFQSKYLVLEKPAISLHSELLHSTPT